MAWAKLKFKHAEVDHAGEVLIAHNPSEEDYDRAVEITNNWRSCHAFPLNTFQATLRRKARAVDPKAMVAQRTKRLPAIVHKLERLRRLTLSQLQDIGGCRAIVADVPRVQQLRDAYVHHSDLRHELINEDNYLISPKKSGYRGIHLVYEYRSDRSGEHDGRKIEMQLRSRLQHAWATAVETVGMFSSQYLKSSRGDKQWLRFFALMGSCIALREKAPMVPGTPSNARQLYAELVELERALDVRRRLKAYGRALNVLGDDNAGYYFLLDLDTEKEVLKVMGFPKSGLLAAQEAYQRREKEVVGRPGRDTVLVSVDSVNHLRSAYPNFYLDTHLFTQALEFSLGQAAKKAT